MKRVLISGASVAGPAAAFWLSRYGFDVTVVEKAPGIRPGGYAVDFRGTAMRVLERMNLIDEIKKREVRATSITMVDEHDRLQARLPDGFTSGELETRRGDLAEVLYAATRQDARYVFGDSIVSIQQRQGGADVKFASGKEESFDLVIGADGLHSNVRSVAFGPEEEFVRHMGYYIAVFTVPDFLGLGTSGKYYVELGRRVGCFGWNDGSAKASFFFVSKKLDYDRKDIDAQKRLLRETFVDMRWPAAPRMLEMMDASPDFYFDSLSQVKMDSWSKERVVLLGDAASCTSPMAGMGTSIAVVGAYVLAGELKNANGDYASAFERFEETMRNFTAEAQKLAEGVSWFIPATRLKLWMSSRMWSMMPKSTMRKLMVEQPARIANMVEIKDHD